MGGKNSINIFKDSEPCIVGEFFFKEIVFKGCLVRVILFFYALGFRKSIYYEHLIGLIVNQFLIAAINFYIFQNEIEIIFILFEKLFPNIMLKDDSIMCFNFY